MTLWTSHKDTEPSTDYSESPAGMDYSMCSNIKLPLVMYQFMYNVATYVSPDAFDERLNQTDCGVSNYNLSQLVVNGYDAPLNAWPWQVSILTKDMYFCGGSVLDREWILTAAHCIQNASTIVFLGEFDISNITKGPYRRVAEKIPHPEFDADSRISDHDIALYKLEEPIEFSDTIRPVCLPEGDIWDSSPCFATGRGSLSRNENDTGIVPARLQQLRVGLMNRVLCKYLTSSLNVFFPSDICIDAPEHAGIYKGDSGGPLNCYKNGRFYVAGVAHTGTKQRFEHLIPDTYTSVPMHMDWVVSTVRNNRR